MVLPCRRTVEFSALGALCNQSGGVTRALKAALPTRAAPRVEYIQHTRFCVHGDARAKFSSLGKMNGKPDNVVARNDGSQLEPMTGNFPPLKFRDEALHLGRREIIACAPSSDVAQLICELMA